MAIEEQTVTGSTGTSETSSTTDGAPTTGPVLTPHETVPNELIVKLRPGIASEYVSVLMTSIGATVAETTKTLGISCGPSTGTPPASAASWQAWPTTR